MSQSHEELTAGQFGARAQAYVESAVHAGGADLDALADLAAAAGPAHALDLGTGGGHVAYLLARHAGKVTAADLSPGMLQTVAAQAREKALGNIETAVAAAESLPFANETFDFLASRFSAHHWRDFAAGLRQARRVLRVGAPAVFIDIVSPGRALLDTHLQTVELLRDPSHVRDHALDAWFSALTSAGFSVRSCRTWRLRMDFAVWTERMGTPAPLAKAIRILQEKAAAETRAHFAIEDDGSFWLDAAMIETCSVETFSVPGA
ncbi:class I SAM-dependent methyltransferase [Rhodoblastus sp.]|uniref:class I SAM-dependent methyltransferase n=1 Tax=Rhodoblastus sp. TaxID=1962975 RepID=UPI003F998152